MPLAVQGSLGLGVFLALCWAASERGAAVQWRTPLFGLALQFALALLLLKVPPVQAVFAWLNRAILALDEATKEGTRFVFGYLGGGEPPFEVTDPAQLHILAFQGLPIILVMSALSALLFYWRILPWVVRGLAALLNRATGESGALGLGVAANVFVGMVEAPLLIRPYLERLTRSELFALMATGMATVAGTMMVLYANVVGAVLDNALGHILVASVISAPAALAVARILVPETETATAHEPDWQPERGAHSAMDAITRGTLSGLELLLNIIALLIVVIALVHMINAGLGLLPGVGGADLTLQRILGWILAPLAWLMGIPWSEAVTAGELLGVKVVLNELVAYIRLTELDAAALSAHSELILTYALCGFANLGSLGIMIGGLGGLVPARRPEIIGLGLKSVAAGVVATAMTGTVVGLVTHGWG